MKEKPSNASKEIKFYGTFLSTDSVEELNSSSTSSADFSNGNEEKLLKDETKENCFEFDKFLQNSLGELGLYQIFIIFMLIIPGCFLSAYSTLDIVFMSYTPYYHCKPNENDWNGTGFTLFIKF